jgi:hypothetical protein
MSVKQIMYLYSYSSLSLSVRFSRLTRKDQRTISGLKSLDRPLKVACGSLNTIKGEYREKISGMLGYKALSYISLNPIPYRCGYPPAEM